MKQMLYRAVAAGVAVLVVFLGVSLRSSLTSVGRAQSDGDPCAPPTQVGRRTPAEIAWRLFVAVNCPVANDSTAVVRWEQWQEQTQIFATSVQATAHRPRFHPSLQAQMLARGAGEFNSPADCALGNKPAYPGGLGERSVKR